VLLGKEPGEDNVWVTVQPPVYKMITSDSLERTIYDFRIEKELIAKYHETFIIGFKLEHITGFCQKQFILNESAD